MPFVSVYTTNPPLLSPSAINASTGTTTDGTAAGVAPFVVQMESVDGVDVDVNLSSGSASYRLYFWTPIGKTGFTNGGTWVPLGGDAVSGVGPTSANASSFGGSANGRYQHRPGKRWWLLVREASSSPTEVWAKIEPRRQVFEG